MKQQIMYRYLGTNGIIDSPVHLEGIYSIKRIDLIADAGYKLTKDNKTYVKVAHLTNEDEIVNWKEVKDNSK